jgi:hypothetical protein
MTDENVIAAWDRLNDYIYGPIICESARWGDERSSNPMDRDHEWDAARLAVRNDMKGRANKFLSQLRSKGYFSTLPAPEYFIGSTEIDTSVLKTAANSTLTIQREGSSGIVYYTIDGSDPRVWDLSGAISAKAISDNGIIISNATILKARTKNGSTWSPLHELLVLPGESLITIVIEPDQSVISEITEVDNAEKILLYPNPVSNKLFLSEHKDFAVYSSMGILMLNGAGTEINMKNLPDGLYFILIDNLSYKVLKNTR